MRQHLAAFLGVGVGVPCLFGCASTPSVYERESDRQGIREIVAQHWPELEVCYLKAIDERPGAEGKLVLSWEIHPDGSTANIRVKEADEKIRMISPCVTERVAKWRFPQFGKEELAAEVIYPFFFSENGKFRK